MSEAISRFEQHVYPWQREAWKQVTESYLGNKLHHGLLVSGQEGLGKRHFAQAVASFLLCVDETENRTEPCGNCTGCLLLKAGSHPDLMMVEPDEAGKQIKIDQVRKVTDFTNQTAQQGGNRVLIIGPAENMNVNSANALLKNLEEPGLKTFLILYTHQGSGVLPTIKSRCQLYSIAIPNAEDIQDWIGGSEEQSKMAIALGHGSPLLAKELLDGDSLGQFSRLLVDLESLLTGQANPIEVAANWKKEDLQKLLGWMYTLCLDLLRVGTTGDKGQARLVSVAHLVEAMSKGANLRLVDQFIGKLSKGRSQLRSGIGNPNQQLLLESLLVDWASLFGTN